MKLTLIVLFTPLIISAGVFNPSAMPDSHVWLDAEGLYWQSNMGSLSYGIEHGHVKQLDFDWDWGVRAGLGYKIPHDKWDLYAVYTHLIGNAHGHAGGGHAGWHMNLNMGDLELGRNCLPSKWLLFRPFMGVRGLVIDNDYSVDYARGTHFHADSDFWGVGLRVGIDSLWGLGKGLGIYGNGSASLLSGHFDVHEKEKFKKAHSHHVRIENDVDNVVAAADLALGLQWDYLFSNDRFHFGFKFGWEFNIFFDQNQLFNFLSSDQPIQFKKDDLTFQGLTLGLRFDF